MTARVKRHRTRHGAVGLPVHLTTSDPACPSRGHRRGHQRPAAGLPHRPPRRARAPDAVWHIVEVSRQSDPAATWTPAIPNDLDLAALTNAGGCLIDTRDLFGVWRDVLEERATAEEVRGSLRGAMTRWTWSGDLDLGVRAGKSLFRRSRHVRDVDAETSSFEWGVLRRETATHCRQASVPSSSRPGGPRDGDSGSRSS